MIRRWNALRSKSIVTSTTVDTSRLGSSEVKDTRVPGTFIFGIDEGIDGSAYLSTEDVYNLVGGNTGNLAFHYAMSRILGRNPPAIPWHSSATAVDALGDIGVMPCANQLGPHANYGSLASKFAALNVSLIAVGLGAQGDAGYDAVPTVPDGTLAWVREIVERRPVRAAPNIGVRGPFTLKTLERYGLASHAVVTGCPTLFLNPDPSLGYTISANLARKPHRIAIAAGHYRWKHLSQLEHSLTRMIGSAGGSYIVQSPIEMIRLARGEAGLLEQETLEACRDYACPDLTADQFSDWSRAYARVFFNVSEWMEHLRGFDYVVGPRIHGVMLGLQAGVPSLCIAHDSRTRELCETLGVPFVLASKVSQGIQAHDLPGLIKFDAESFNQRRRELAKNLDGFLRANGLPPSSWLSQIQSRGQNPVTSAVSYNTATELARERAAIGDDNGALSVWSRYRDQSPLDPRGFLEGSAAARHAKNNKEAEQISYNAIELFRDNPEIAAEYARVAFDRRDLEVAITRWTDVAARFPDYAPGFAGLAQALRVSGRIEEAEQIAGPASLRMPDDPALAIEFARGAFNRRDLDEALSRWEGVRLRFPSLLDGYTGAVQSLRVGKRLSEAEELARFSKKKFGRVMELEREYARLADSAEDLSEAKKRWSAFRDNFPDDIEGYLAVSRAHRLAEEFDLAYAEILRAQLRFTDARIEIEAAICARLAGQIQKALHHCATLRDRFPTRSEGWSIAVAILREAGRASEAQELTVGAP